MEKCFFLLLADSEIISETSSCHQLLHGIGNSSDITNSILYTFVLNWSTLKQVREEIPNGICILLDVDTENAEKIRQFITNLPGMDCIIDFNGKLQDPVLSQVFNEMGIVSKSVIWKKQDINIRSVDAFLKSNTECDTVLISVQKKAKSTTFQSVARCAQTVKKFQGIALAAAAGHNKEKIKFQPSRRFSVSSEPGPSTLTLPSSFAISSETSSLIPPPINASRETVTFSSITSWLCCCWCPSLSSDHSPAFLSQAQLQSYIRGEWHMQLSKKLNQLFLDFEEELEQLMNEIDAKVEKQVEGMRKEHEESKEEKVKQYENVKARNKGKASNGDQISARIASSREYHALRKVKWSEQDFNKAANNVNQQFEGEREGKRKIHYEKVVKQELRILRESRAKFHNLYQQLFQNNCSNW